MEAEAEAEAEAEVVVVAVVVVAVVVSPQRILYFAERIDWQTDPTCIP